MHNNKEKHIFVSKIEPEYEHTAISESVDMSSLADLASKIYADRDTAIISHKESITMKKLIFLGTSAGGMRPKAVVLRYKT